MFLARRPKTKHIDKFLDSTKPSAEPKVPEATLPIFGRVLDVGFSSSHKMHCNLLNLPAEVHLEIIKELLQDENIDTHTNHGQRDENGFSEKHEKPVKIYRDLINWSCTCSYFRSLLAPNIFKTTKLVNDEKSGSSLIAVAKGPHTIHVKELYFIGSVLRRPHIRVAPSNSGGILPYNVDTLLRDLQQFPNLEKLSIEIDNKPAIYKCGCCGHSLHETAIGTARWYALLFRTYSALTQNKSPRFKHLEIRQLVWKEINIFRHAAFHDFLGHFEQFTLSIFSPEPINGKTSDTSNEYPAVMKNLHKYFFNHLVNVTTLSIKAPKMAPLGLEGLEYSSRLTLSAGQMPLLVILHLDSIIACRQLIAFLVGHKRTLQEVTLHDCYACGEYLTHDSVKHGITWSKLFTSISSARPAQLRRFELAGSFMPFPSEYEEDAEDKMVLTILRQDPERILFPYVEMCYGFQPEPCYDVDRSFDAFFRGEDQRAWDQLMKLVKENVKKAEDG